MSRLGPGPEPREMTSGSRTRQGRCSAPVVLR